MDTIANYIKPELLILVPVLYLIGAGLKRSQSVDDRRIPLLLGVCGVLLAAVYVLASAPVIDLQDGLMALFVAISQGILCTGASVYTHQLIKQRKE